MSPRPICYLDNNATTRVAPEVIAAMMPFLEQWWGNASSAYQFGRQVGGHVEKARETVAALLHAEPKEIVFTSCGTESNNTAIHSALMVQPGKRHVITTAVEHSANLNFGEYLQRRGYDVTYLPVESDGSLDIHALDQSIREDTAIVSVMWANNETGVLFPIEEIAAICRSRGVPFHTDAVQAPGKVKLDVRATGVDFLSLSGHKLHAPKGVGVLYVRRRSRFQPYLIGGHQERGRRAGTENVPYIVGLGTAAELALRHLRDDNVRLGRLRDRLEDAILGGIPQTFRNGAREPRLSNTTNISFDFVEAEAILAMLDQVGICASSGSACTTGSSDPSHVLAAMGVPVRRARGAVRFSLGAYTTDAEVDFVLSQLPGIMQRLRSISPLSPEHPDNDGEGAGHRHHRHEPAQGDAEKDDKSVVV